MPPHAEALIPLAKLGRAHGIKGEIRVHTHTEAPFVRSGPVTLQCEGKPDHTLNIARTRQHQGQLVALFEGINDRTTVEALCGATLCVTAKALPEPDEGTVYLHAILGLDVVLHATGTPLGKLEHALFHGGQEVWSITTPEGKEVLLPAVPEFVNDIDLDTGIIRVTPPEGLLELYL